MYDPGWLQCGFDLWKNMRPERDYVLPSAASDLLCARRTVAKHADLNVCSLASLGRGRGQRTRRDAREEVF